MPARARAIAMRVWRSFDEDECAFLAGAVAYQLFFALLPLLFLIVGALGFFLTREELSDRAAVLMRDVFPVTGERRIVQELVNGRALSLGIGLVGSIWAVTAIHDALSRALGAVLGKGQRRPFVRDKLAAFGFAALLFVLAVLSFALSFVVQALADVFSAIGLHEAQRVGLGIVSPAFGFLAGVALFALVYRAIPARRLPRGSILVGAVTAALLWEIAKGAFALYSRATGAFRAFGPLALAAGLITWIYLSAVIVLLGAEIIKAVQQERAAD